MTRCGAAVGFSKVRELGNAEVTSKNVPGHHADGARGVEFTPDVGDQAEGETGAPGGTRSCGQALGGRERTSLAWAAGTLPVPRWIAECHRRPASSPAALMSTAAP